MKLSGQLTRALINLLASSPSITAAMRAGRKATIQVRVYRAATGQWEDHGTAVMQPGRWESLIKAIWPGKTVVRFTLNGKEYERSNF